MAKINANIDSKMAKINANIDSKMAKINANIDSKMAKVNANIDGKMAKINSFDIQLLINVGFPVLPGKPRINDVNLPRAFVYAP